MKITRKREIISERTRRVTIKFGNTAGERFCQNCQARVPFLTVDEAALIRQTTARQIFRLVEKQTIHFEEIENGSLLVCFASLSNTMDESF